MTTIRAAALALSLALAAHAGYAGPGAAQQALLVQAEARMLAGEHESARGILGRWWENPTTGDERARALLLRARLSADPLAAEKDYLEVVFGYPSTPEASESLLRLGQWSLAIGEPERAAGYLERLIADYPASVRLGAAQLWLARSRARLRDERGACAAARAAMQAGRDPEILALAERELDACSAAGGGGAVLGEPAAGRPAAPAAAPPAAAARAPAGPYAAQVGAFRSGESARELVDRLRRSGFEARVVALPGSTLLRVRVGSFADVGSAMDTRQRLRLAGFDSVVVTDALRESPVR